jgi:2,4-dienoyl-CoA reductase (NADPH2)
MFTPLSLGPDIGSLPNRVIMGSMHTGLEGHSIPAGLLWAMNASNDDHHDMTKMAIYFEERAKGGVGLMGEFATHTLKIATVRIIYIIFLVFIMCIYSLKTSSSSTTHTHTHTQKVTGGISPNRRGWVGPFAGKLSTETERDRHKVVTDAVHSVRIPTYSSSDNNTMTDTTTVPGRICLQILHTGRYAYHPFAVSATSTQSPISPFRASALSLPEVKSTIHDFVNCATLAKEAGYDGVEIMGSEGYLINQFLVTRTNHRTDEYGGSVTNRMRLALDIVSEVRAACGRDFIIIFRLSMLDLVNDGSSWEEIKTLAQSLEHAGVTIINTGIGWHEARIPTIATSVPRGAFAFVTKKLREENIVSVPLCATNRINSPSTVESILAGGSADLISMARPFLADPEIVRKSREGRADEINTCIACNQACLDHAFVGKTASCLVNPRACHETELSIVPDSVPLDERLNIGVVGTGPAGMSFAMTAATIGHEVTLFDKSTEIGGQFNMAKRIPGKEEFNETIRYFTVQLEKLKCKGKLDMRLGTEISFDDMERMSSTEISNGKKIDRWIIATGVDPRMPNIPGSEHPNVLSYIDVLRHKKKVGHKVAVIGAGGIGFDVSEYLLHHDIDDQDKRVDDVNADEFLVNWGVDKSLSKRGGLLPDESIQMTKPHREIILMQRKKGKLGAGLGKTTGWIHRSTLVRSKCVEMLSDISYDKIDEKGHLHITIGKGDKKKTRVLEVDNIVLCAGQISKNELEKAAVDSGGILASKVFTIGGAYEAGELDAKRAIDMGTRLALRIKDDTIVPGKHVSSADSGAEEKLYKNMMKMMR